MLRRLVALALGVVIVVWPDVSAGVLTGGLAILVGIGLLAFGVIMLVSATSSPRHEVTEVR